MVKNTKGGKGAKGLARKSSSASGGGAGYLPLSTSDFEKYGFVSKIFGNCMCQILFHDGSQLIGHIRGKFRGRNKRNNIIKTNDVVLVGLRDLENPPKNCDIMYIYDDNEVRTLQENPAFNINKLLRFTLFFNLHGLLFG
jgi:initiation factor 1A